MPLFADRTVACCNGGGLGQLQASSVHHVGTHKEHGAVRHPAVFRPLDVTTVRGNLAKRTRQQNKARGEINLLWSQGKWQCCVCYRSLVKPYLGIFHHHILTGDSKFVKTQEAVVLGLVAHLGTNVTNSDTWTHDHTHTQMERTSTSIYPRLCASESNKPMRVMSMTSRNGAL